MENRKSILLIEDELAILHLYNAILSKNYNVTSILYNETNIRLPTERFDRTILDGLNGEWKTVANQINVEKIIVVSGDCKHTMVAMEKGLSTLVKPFNCNKLLELLIIRW